MAHLLFTDFYFGFSQNSFCNRLYPAMAPFILNMFGYGGWIHSGVDSAARTGELGKILIS